MLNRYVILDVETIGAPDAEQWIGEITAPGNYSKPDTIAKYLTEEKANRIARAPLDADLCRIVAFGMQSHVHDAPVVFIAHTEEDERDCLQQVWLNVNATTPMLGYGVSWFDAGVLVRRSQLLGVTVPSGMYEQGKYRHPWIVELADRLTLNGMIDQQKGRGLDYHCKRFGITVDDPYSGKDVAQLWADGNIEAIKSHCLADLSRIRQLAERLQVIQPVQELVL